MDRDLCIPACHVCGLITDEKERGTLSLMLLTDISPLEAVLQKYFAGLIPMFTLLMLTLPVGGFAYMLGGLTVSMVVYGTSVLLITAATVGAIALACSSYARTTIGSFMGTYGILGILFLLPRKLPREMDVNDLIGFLCLFGVIAAGALVVACITYKSRAHIGTSTLLRRMFQKLDRGFHRLNNRIGGIQVVRDHGTLPDAHPILWREKHRRQLGKVQYRIRYLVVLEIAAFMAPTLGVGNLSYAFYVGWGFAALVLTVQASNSIVSERLSQTLEVLLTTPLSGASIVREKAHALAPLAAIMVVPIMTLAMIEAFSVWAMVGAPVEFLRFILGELLHLILFLTLFVMIGIAVGLDARSRLTAMMKLIGVLVILMALPHLIELGLNALWTRERGMPFRFHSPASVIYEYHVEAGSRMSVSYGWALMIYGVMIIAL
jgi:ABC-type transport system involved in multi-copper enzyme maturation permease subunit